MFMGSRLDSGLENVEVKRVLGLALLLASFVMASGGSAVPEEGKIYECTDAKGQVVYQDEPCLEAVPVAPKHQAAPKPPSAVKPRRSAPSAAASPARPSPQEPPLSRGPVDARWATPDKTLKTFVGAVTAGDRALVLACLTSSALADLGPNVEAIPLEKLRETVSSFTGYVAEGDLGPFWSIRAKRAGLRPKWIFFEQTGTGEWKIAAI